MASALPSASHPQLGRPSRPADNDAWRPFLCLYEPALSARPVRSGHQPHDADEETTRVLSALARALSGPRLDSARLFLGFRHRMTWNEVASFWRRQASRPDAVGVGGPSGQARLAGRPAWGEVADEVGDQQHRDPARRKRLSADNRPRAYHQTPAGRSGMGLAAVYLARSRTGRPGRDAIGRADQP